MARVEEQRWVASFCPEQRVELSNQDVPAENRGQLTAELGWRLDRHRLPLTCQRFGGAQQEAEVDAVIERLRMIGAGSDV